MTVDLIRAIQSRLTSTTSTNLLDIEITEKKKREARIGKFIIQALLVKEARTTKREKKKKGKAPSFHRA
jgi:hypothetical protein